jgi:hypothetical protein
MFVPGVFALKVVFGFGMIRRNGMLRKGCIRCGGKTRILTRKTGWYRKCRKCVSKKCGIYWHVEEATRDWESLNRKG